MTITQPTQLYDYKLHFVLDESSSNVAVLARDHRGHHRSKREMSQSQAHLTLCLYFWSETGDILMTELKATGRLDLDRKFSKGELVRLGFIPDELD
jgi:hypothetical protein